MEPPKVLVNIGKIVTGRLDDPLSEADTILIAGGAIKQIGLREEFELNDSLEIFDLQGMILAPGLIDAHVHPGFEDWHPRLKVADWMEAMLHAGITSLISQGIVHLSGRPRDAVGTKCIAILASKIMSAFRPGNALKAHFGTVVLEPGLSEKDFAEMSEHGVNIVAEIGGGGGVSAPEDVMSMVGWARKYGMKVCIHVGGAAVPSATTMGAEEVFRIQPDIVCHLNGGSTAAPWKDIIRIIEGTNLPLELVYNGNPRRLCEIVELLKQRGQLHRIFLGSDQPVGIGFSPASILKTVVLLSSLGKIPAELSLAFGTGNTARVFELNEGTVEPGKPADLIALDKPVGSEGDTALESIEIGDVPAVGMIMVDGRLVATRGRMTPQPSSNLLVI